MATRPGVCMQDTCRPSLICLTLGWWLWGHRQYGFHMLPNCILVVMFPKGTKPTLLARRERYLPFSWLFHLLESLSVGLPQGGRLARTTSQKHPLILRTGAGTKPGNVHMLMDHASVPLGPPATQRSFTV